MIELSRVLTSIMQLCSQLLTEIDNVDALCSDLRKDAEHLFLLIDSTSSIDSSNSEGWGKVGALEKVES